MASNDFDKKLMDDVISSVKRELQARFSSIRLPETGELLSQRIPSVKDSGKPRP